MSLGRVAIIGINAISASIAFKLQAQKEPFEVIGYDADPAIADLAQARGAFDRVVRKPGRACQDVDVVIIAEPVTAIRDTFVAIAPHLRPDCFVIDTARLKTPVLRWAEEFLPEHVIFIGGHLIPNPAVVGSDPLEGLDDASAELLKEALYCFTTPPSASGEAIESCLWLAETLQVHSFFIDATEHDGLQAGIEGLPDLLTIALLQATVDTPGWQEMRKFAGSRFAAATDGVNEARERHRSLFLNRQNVLHRLDGLIAELMHLRDVLSQSDEEALAETITRAAEGRSRWMKERRQGMWVREGTFDTRDVTSVGQQIGQMFFGGLADRLRQRPGRSDEE